MGNEFISNSAKTNSNGYGGAVYVQSGDALIRGNTFVSNTGRHGGAVDTMPSGSQPVVIDRNVFYRNASSQYGGAMRIGQGSVATLTNNIIAENESLTGDAILVDSQHHCVIAHNTVAGVLSGTAGAAIYVRAGNTSADLRNNIIVSHTYGIRTNNTVTVTADHTLFYGNDQDVYVSGGILTSTNQITGLAPLFVDPAASDYHLAANSPAVDAAPDAGVAIDIDNEPRPNGGAWDIGADEVILFPLAYAYLPLALR
jgi:hypothetical protein